MLLNAVIDGVTRDKVDGVICDDVSYSEVKSRILEIRHQNRHRGQELPFDFVADVSDTVAYSTQDHESHSVECPQMNFLLPILSCVERYMQGHLVPSHVKCLQTTSSVCTYARHVKCISQLVSFQL